MLSRFSGCLALAIAAFPFTTTAQPTDAWDSEPMSTDRPDFTEATDVMPKGILQMESGLVTGVHHLAAGPSRSVTLPSLLLRLGLTRRVELRWGSDGFTNESDHFAGEEQHHSGISDMNLGFKASLWEQPEESNFVPAVSVIAGVSFPVGAGYFSTGGRDPFVKLCWSRMLSGGFDVGGNFNSQWEVHGGGAERAMSVTAGRAFSAGLRLYGEIYRISPIEDDEPNHWIVNGGVTKQLSRDYQIDFELGHTANARTPYTFVGVGFSARMPLGFGR